MSTETNPAEPGSLRNAGPWEHLDGTPCPYYVASRPRPSADEYWWCTEHQQHVRPAEPDAGVWNDEPTSAELDLIRLVLASDWLVEVRRIAAKETAERIAEAIEARYLGPDSGRGYDGSEAPDAHCRNAYDEGLYDAARIARAEADR